MFRCLSPGALGVQANLIEGLQYARIGGFQGLEVNIREIARLIDQHGSAYVKDLFLEAGIRPGGWGLPLNWRGSEEEFQQGLEELPRYAQAGQSIQCLRTATWILPFSDERPYEENFQWHINRFRPIAQVLKDYGCSLGLEFIGPKTVRQGHRYEFIYTLKGMLELCNAIGTGNVGLLLDCWHWYTSYGTIDDLKVLKPEQVVYVHVNDAPAGIPIEEQRDNVRCLPGETGVIDIVGFLQSLKEIGYEGPVTPEPFSQKLRELPPEEAVRVTGEALLSVWKKAGLD